MANNEWVSFQVLGARSTEEDVESLQDARPVAGRPHHQARQEVSIHVSLVCLFRILSPGVLQSLRQCGAFLLASARLRDF